MPNKVILKNRIKKENPELAKRLEQEAKQQMCWGFQKDRSVIKKDKKDKTKENHE